MVITMTRYTREELEKAVEEKLSQGYVCLGNGIVDVSKDNKHWDASIGGKAKFCGRFVQKKFSVKMKKSTSSSS